MPWLASKERRILVRARTPSANLIPFHPYTSSERTILDLPMPEAIPTGIPSCDEV
jgi:hypothetical protein